MSSLASFLAEPDRRAALKLMTLGMAAALARCSRPDEEIIPYARMPEGLAAGEPMQFATTLSLSGYGRGFLATSVDGRPIKIEGNPRHPFSQGATDVFAEAEVLSLYGIDRLQSVTQRGHRASWPAFKSGWQQLTESTQGGDIAIVSGRIVAPTTVRQIAAARARFPDLRWYRYEPVNDDSAQAGAKLAFGQTMVPRHSWAKADVIVLLAADPLGHGPEQLRNARAFASRRAPGHRQRLYVVEPFWTLTGAAADFRLALPPDQIREVGRAIANHFGAELGAPTLPPDAGPFVARLIGALSASQGSALVVAGEGQPAELHALCHWINQVLGAPVSFLAPIDPVTSGHAATLDLLAQDLHARRIKTLLIIDANPVYDAPEHHRLAEAIGAVPFSAYLGQHANETAERCQWHLPLSHPLESWGDSRAADGTASLIQPLIKRLYDSKTCNEVLALIADRESSAHDLTRATWTEFAPGNFDDWWRASLEDGVIANSVGEPLAPTVKSIPDLPREARRDGITLLLAPDAGLWDGRFANNAWLQECPHPFTKQVWGNALQLSPQDARKLGIEDEETAEIEIDKRTERIPVVIAKGQAPGVALTTLGYGRTEAGLIGSGVGSRFCGMSSTSLARSIANIHIDKSQSARKFLSTETRARPIGPAEKIFPIASVASLAEGAKPEKEPPSLLPVPARGAYAWAMVIDSDACIGCNACVVACQAENNVPVVGPGEVALGRDMHWLRVDIHAREEDGISRRGFQPVPCMHCELAPCEPVCPVEASVHDRQGLNVQVYNRCIGTRFCEANCPYKVRRFNWFEYAGSQAYADLAQPLRAQHNPDVSSRPRGVMEKCNYCLQRISRARHRADRENRKVTEGEMVTACQAACPTRAIHFGDLNRSDSQVSTLRRDPRHYTLLAELNTRPRTTYLKRLYGDDQE